METNSPPSEEPTIYALRYLPYAIRSFNDAVIFVYDTCGTTDPEAYALTFQRGLVDALSRLATMPLRYAVAAEAENFAPPPVRAMRYQQMPGSPIWRVLYRVREADENEGPRIEIVAVRHGAQKPITRAEGRDIDAANR